MGTLYYGENLDILRSYLKDESLDLVYLAPPFNSAQNRLQDTYGRRLKFVIGSAAQERGVHAASTSERDATSKRAEARAHEFRAALPRGQADRPVSPTESLVRIMGEPTTPEEAATRLNQTRSSD